MIQIKPLFGVGLSSWAFRVNIISKSADITKAITILNANRVLNSVFRSFLKIVIVPCNQSIPKFKDLVSELPKIKQIIFD
jgi:hypothetical protein